MFTGAWRSPAAHALAERRRDQRRRHFTSFADADLFLIGAIGNATPSATAEDAAQIHAIYVEERHEERSIGIRYERADWATFVNVPQIILLVAEVSGRIEGFLLGYDQFDWGYIETLIVRRDARGRDLGRRIINAFAKYGEGRWVALELAIEPDDVRLQRFTDRAGFTKKTAAVWCVRDLEEE